MGEEIEKIYDLIREIERRLDRRIDVLEKKVFVGDVFFRVVAWLVGVAVGLASAFGFLLKK